MVLVTYSDSESDVDTQDAVTPISQPEDLLYAHVGGGSKKRKASDIHKHGERRAAPPPLPSSLHSLYATNVRSSTSDDPFLHGGRQRQIPHIQGQWPSHVYLEWFPQKDETTALCAIISQAQLQFKPEIEALTATQIHSFLETPLGVQLPLHVSLSAPLVLDTNEKDDFQTTILARIRSSGIRSFGVDILGLDWVANHNNSRHFLVLRLTRPLNNELNELLRCCNQTCEEFGLPLLYRMNTSVGVSQEQKIISQSEDCCGEDIACNTDKSDAFHVSIAWTLAKPNVETVSEVSSLWKAGKLGMIRFTEVMVKVGSTVTNYTLPANDEVFEEVAKDALSTRTC